MNPYSEVWSSRSRRRLIREFARTMYEIRTLPETEHPLGF